MVDGPGLRSSIYCAGCAHHCKGCHNPQTWDFSAGELMTTEQIMSRLLANPFDDVTFSGGDPMFQPEGFIELAKAIRRQTNKDIWCYTGFNFEDLVYAQPCENAQQHDESDACGASASDGDSLRSAQRELLNYIDVLVDGKFVESQRDIHLRFRGSRNQRLIDVKQSLLQHHVVLWND